MRLFSPIRNLWSRLRANVQLRERLYSIIFESDTPMGKLFDVVLLWAILLSIVLIVIESIQGLPPIMKTVFQVWEYIFTFFFTVEYLCRLYCSPTPRKYAFSFFGIIDLLSTLPLYLGWFFGGMRYMMVLRTFRLIRVFRVFKLFSFLEEGDMLLRSLYLSSRKILIFFIFVVIMVISLGTLMFMVEGNVEGSEFCDIPTSIYWAVVTMTTVGYGDIAPVTNTGRFLSAIVMLLGYTIMAVPTGIVSAQFIHDHEKLHPNRKKCPECGKRVNDKDHYCSFCGKELD